MEVASDTGFHEWLDRVKGERKKTNLPCGDNYTGKHSDGGKSLAGLEKGDVSHFPEA